MSKRRIGRKAPLRCRPEQKAALVELVDSLQLYQSMLCEKMPISVDTGFKGFFPGYIKPADLPAAVGWSWRQNSSRKSFELTGGASVVLRKLTPRPREDKHNPQVAPKGKSWLAWFSTPTISQSSFVWVERGVEDGRTDATCVPAASADSSTQLAAKKEAQLPSNGPDSFGKELCSPEEMMALFSPSPAPEREAENGADRRACSTQGTVWPLEANMHLESLDGYLERRLLEDSLNVPTWDNDNETMWPDALSDSGSSWQTPL